MTSPSEPVESREQPRGHRIDIELAVSHAIVGGYDPDDDDIEKQRDDLLAVVYCWRDEQLTDARREAAREFESGNEWCQRALAAETDLQGALTERDAALVEGEEAAREAREWAALAQRWHVEVSRLREQGEAIRAVCAEPCRGMGCTGNDDGHIDPADILAILEAK